MLALVLLACMVVAPAHALEYSYVGCFADGNPRAIGTQVYLPSSMTGQMTVERCAQAVVNQGKGYTIFSVQVGSKCCQL